jgi:hypothetical protein
MRRQPFRARPVRRSGRFLPGSSLLPGRCRRPGRFPRRPRNRGRSIRLLTPLQRQNVALLMNDLNTLRISQVTPALRHQLQNHLLAGVEGGTRPTDYAVIRVVNDLSVAWFMTRMLPVDQSRLALNLNWIMNSSRLNQDQAQYLLQETRLLLQNSGMTAQDIQTLLNSLAGIIMEVQQQPLIGQPQPF